MKKIRSGVFIAPGRKPWPHELRVAEILAIAGHSVEFLNETNLHTADILLDGIEYEIKSPKSAAANSLEHLIKKALRQSSNLIIDTSRIKGAQDEHIIRFFLRQAKEGKTLKKLLIITKRDLIIDIFSLF